MSDPYSLCEVISEGGLVTARRWLVGSHYGVLTSRLSSSPASSPSLPLPLPVRLPPCLLPPSPP